MPPPLALTFSEPAGTGPDPAIAVWRRRTDPSSLILALRPAVRLAARQEETTPEAAEEADAPAP
jgi:hypothetical protein